LSVMQRMPPSDRRFTLVHTFSCRLRR